MTSADGTRPDPSGEPDTETPLDDGPVIDPRDPLGLGALPLGDPDLDADADERSMPVVAAQSPDEQDAPAQDVLPVEHPDEPPVGAARDDRSDDDRSDDGGSDDGGSDDLHADDLLSDADEPLAVRSPDEGPDGDGSVDGVDDAGGESSQGPPSAAAVRPARSGWARLGHAMRPRTTQGQLITAALCALLGFALVVQVRQATDTQLGALRQNDLVRLLDETTTRTDELEQESLDLQRERDELLSGSDRQQAALDAARRTAAMQGILTGRLPATGPGVRITLTEPDGEIRPATMLHVLEELRNAGAEAMELNGHRITASSAFTGTRGAVELDGATLRSPFRWSVIGDPDTIAPALEIPGGALVRVRADGGRGTVEKSDRVDVTAVRTPHEPEHASPASDEG
ncbi:DUF881 domain-containing protein [Cellulomonas xiejunii]|uniref:DUF881 domain-containing protein n=1 Tax=Cellulomonas xiejunii TaxID=2968083 RepID=UPI001D0DD71E|nr:DUF881 domain-containing protein [Cellulomonas xiejunii]MCC2313048.1 DUF881 domain-containing protein [Cellulomonas xiejunii]